MNMEWSYKELEEICTRAGLEEEWHNADCETFEDVVYKALEILGF